MPRPPAIAAADVDVADTAPGFDDTSATVPLLRLDATTAADAEEAAAAEAAGDGVACVASDGGGGGTGVYLRSSAASDSTGANMESPASTPMHCGAGGSAVRDSAAICCPCPCCCTLTAAGQPRTPARRASSLACASAAASSFTVVPAGKSGSGGGQGAECGRAHENRGAYSRMARQSRRLKRGGSRWLVGR